MVERPKPATVRLDAWLTPGQLAKRIGWGHRRMLRVLQTLNDQCNGMLLKDTARHENPRVVARPKWVLSLARLEIVAPHLMPPPKEDDPIGPQMGVHVERHNRPAAVRVGRDAA